MTRLLAGLITGLILASSTTLAFDLPYGVQDPMGSGRFVNCSGGEIGYWNVTEQMSSDGSHKIVYLILTTVDLPDPAFVICIVPATRKVLVMEPGTSS